MDARRKGGNIPFNLLEALLVKGTRTPEQHARYTFENTDNYDDMVNAMGDHDIVNPLYYILSGAEYPQGAVLARDRAGVVHDYRMDEIVRTPGGNVQQDFWVGITNYDLELVTSKSSILCFFLSSSSPPLLFYSSYHFSQFYPLPCLCLCS